MMQMNRRHSPSRRGTDRPGVDAEPEVDHRSDHRGDEDGALGRCRWRGGGEADGRGDRTVGRGVCAASGGGAFVRNARIEQPNRIYG